MIDLEREFNLIASLSASEKRFITLVGRAVAGSSSSKHLALFDVLNRMKSYSGEACRKNKSLQAMEASLPTLARRLRQFIFKCLQHLGSDRSSSSRLAVLVQEVEFLVKRKQSDEALRAARKGHRLASEFGRYELVIPFIDWQRRILLDAFPNDVMQQLSDLHLELNLVMSKLQHQQQLRHFQVLLTSERRLAKAFRSPNFQQIIHNIQTHQALHADRLCDDLLTESLVVDVKGLLLLANRKGGEALELYSQLLKRWQDEPEWILEFSDIYMGLFKNYQMSVFWGTLSDKRLRSYLELMPSSDALPPQSQLDLQRLHYGHLITLGLNTGRFELVLGQIPSLLDWIKTNSQFLPMSSKLAFQYNICITYFLNGNYREAYQHLQVITQQNNLRDREDILDFSRVLQAILRYQLNDHDLGEYMVRSARQFFKRNQRQWAFEEAVLRYLNASITTKDNRLLKRIESQLVIQLDAFAAETSERYPLLGLVEVQCWLESRRTKKPIREVFLSRLVVREA